MILDARGDIPALDDRYDCCIVGAGPAGMTLAFKLAESEQRVLLLEAGDWEVTWESQDLYEGENLGLEYYPLSAPRLRALGGSTGHWGGVCLLLDRSDFLPRDDVPLSGWPIRFEDLVPYQEEAANLLQTGRFSADIRKPVDDLGNLEIVEQRFSSDRQFHDVRNEDPVRFGVSFQDRLKNTPNIDLVLNANVVGFAVDGDTGRITQAQVRNYEDGQGVATADRFVLALGGIETSRMLLHLNAGHENRFGNQNDMVGRCFMEHPIIDNDTYFITKRLYSHSPTWELERLLRRSRPELLLSPSHDHMLKNGWLNSAVRLQRLNPLPIREKAIGDAEFIKSLQFEEDYFFTGTSFVMGEQQPNPASRIVLTENRDRFGLGIVGLDLRLTEKDIETLRGSTAEAAKFLIRSGLGRMRVDPSLWNRKPLEQLPLDYSSHHMGGARMSLTSETGVVDANCKVHGAPNLYVAGSGVFPTSGHANPTFTIVQLSLRLAEHLADPTA
ncbi:MULTISPECIES: GMC oxidoreductase [unclassified Ruegeria]|uniref:GMC oxidoreductase n=1 Tax=unclassified Ruegeria TaxID=2625375 RepID=UPI0014890FE3|nr:MULTISPECIES: GMC family oxidoreductase [unclassified Ruegeria]